MKVPGKPTTSKTFEYIYHTVHGPANVKLSGAFHVRENSSKLLLFENGTSYVTMSFSTLLQSR
jgi:hypothetical protein